MGGGYAWVTLATNDSYSLGALVLAHSLKQVGTQQQLVVLITPGVTNSMRSKLSEIFNVVKEVNILDSNDETNLRLLKRPELGITFTKLHCWRLTQYEKCVFLDADTLVLDNCDELFEREELSAAPDIGWPDCFNSGVFVYRPSNETYEKLIQFSLEKGSFDGGDQGLLNLYFSDWAHKDITKHLPFIYNMSSTACYSYLPAFKQFGKNAKILHFIGSSKPWLQYLNTETRKVQPSEGLQHLEQVLQRWWNIFCDLIHPALSSDMAGLAGAFASLTLGKPRTPEQQALDDHLRRQGWEVGNIDYLGRDSFENIWSKICETLSEAPDAEIQSLTSGEEAAEPVTQKEEASPEKAKIVEPLQTPAPPEPVTAEPELPAPTQEIKVTELSKETEASVAPKEETKTETPVDPRAVHPPESPKPETKPATPVPETPSLPELPVPAPVVAGDPVTPTAEGTQIPKAEAPPAAPIPESSKPETPPSPQSKPTETSPTAAPTTPQPVSNQDESVKPAESVKTAPETPQACPCPVQSETPTPPPETPQPTPVAPESPKSAVETSKAGAVSSSVVPETLQPIDSSKSAAQQPTSQEAVVEEASKPQADALNEVQVAHKEAPKATLVDTPKESPKEPPKEVLKKCVEGTKEIPHEASPSKEAPALAPKESEQKDTVQPPPSVVTEPTPPTTPATPPTPPVAEPIAPSPLSKPGLQVDSTVPDTPPASTQEAASGPTPPPRKGAGAPKKTGGKKK